MSGAPGAKQNCPCINCGERHVNCHAKCEAYKSWHESRVAMAADIRRMRERENTITEYQKKEIQKNKRKR